MLRIGDVECYVVLGDRGLFPLSPVDQAQARRAGPQHGEGQAAGAAGTDRALRPLVLIAGDLEMVWVDLGVPAVAGGGVLLEYDGDLIADPRAAHPAGVALRQVHTHPATVSRLGSAAGLYQGCAERTLYLVRAPEVRCALTDN